MKLCSKLACVLLIVILVAAAAAQQQAICPKCGFANPAANKFCNKCGASLFTATMLAKRARATCRIISISGDRAMLDAGKESGVSIGRRFGVEVVDSVIKNPLTGEILKAFTKKTAEFIVEETEDKYSWARVKLLDSSFVLGIGTEVRSASITLSALLPGATFVQIPPGTFIMGSSRGHVDETPPHEVRIPEFWLMTAEVTQKQWNTVMGSNPSIAKGDSLPVNGVIFAEITQFISRLNQGNPHYRFRLPTEAEWEYACRAGTSSEYCYGDGVSDLGKYGWYGENSGGAPHAVASLEPNAWGLYDLYGNVKEWCADFYASHYYGKSQTDSPRGPKKGAYKVCRGGGYRSNSEELRNSRRRSYEPGYIAGYYNERLVSYYYDRHRFRDTGFRLVLEGE
jgi:formylglycine-generating enzyme required for sulfatase activity